MSGRETPPQVGASLLTAVSASLAALRAHLTDPDPKVSLRASAELTKLLSVCARYGIEIGEVVAAEERPHPPAPSPSRRGGVQDAEVNGEPPEQLETNGDTEQRHPAEHPLSGAGWGPGGGVSSTPTPTATRPRPRRTPFHELHARPDRPPPEVVRPPSAIPA